MFGHRVAEEICIFLLEPYTVSFNFHVDDTRPQGLCHIWTKTRNMTKCPGDKDAVFTLISTLQWASVLYINNISNIYFRNPKTIFRKCQIEISSEDLILTYLVIQQCAAAYQSENSLAERKNLTVFWQFGTNIWYRPASETLSGTTPLRLTFVAAKSAICVQSLGEEIIRVSGYKVKGNGHFTYSKSVGDFQKKRIFAHFWWIFLSQRIFLKAYETF